MSTWWAHRNSRDKAWWLVAAVLALGTLALAVNAANVIMLLSN